MTPKSGRAIAWLSFLLGISVSIAGNIGHAASDGMKPGEWAGAAFWPLALMLTIEILTRVRWQPEKRWIIARIAGLVLVAMVAAVLSYRHLAGLMTYWGEDPLNAYLGPLAVDGLMLVAATALLSISKEETLPEEWQGTPEEISRKAFDRGVAAERTSTEALALFKSDTEKTNAFVAQHIHVASDTSRVETTQHDTPDVDGPELMPEPEDAPEKSKLHVVKSVSTSDAEEAALQAWLNSGKTMSSQKLANVSGLSKSTAARRIRDWKSQSSGRRIER